MVHIFMKRNLGKMGTQILVALMSVTLVISGPGGVVLCIGADGHAELKPAYHEKTRQKDHNRCQCCSHHHRQQELHSEQQGGISGDKVQPEHNRLQGCTDLVVFESYAEVGSDNYQTGPIIVGAVANIVDIFFSVENTEDITPWHPPDEKNPSLPSLQTVILLT